MERAILAVGAVFVTCALGLSAYDEWLLRLLPADPERYLALRRAARDGVGSLMLPLGFTLLVLCLADGSRAATLRSRRALLRGATLAGVVALAWLAGAVRGGEDAATGEALLAAGRDLLATRWLMRALIAAIGVLLWAAYRAPAPPPPVPGPDGRYPSPWIPPLFGATPALPARQWRVLGLMIAAGLFNAYDQQILSLALKQVQAGLGVAEEQLGTLGSVIRLGAVPGIALVLLGDVLGRRRLLLVSIVGYTLSTGATAFAPDERSFIACQFLARAFGAAEAGLAAVVVAEEIDADQRGWALGVLAGLSFLGVALAWVLFASVEALPFGWRGLYAVGLAPLALIAWLRRRLPETQRFERERARRPGVSGVRAALRPAVSLLQSHSGRFAAVSAVGFLMAFSGYAGGFFFPKYLQDVHGLEPARLTLLAAVIGIVGMCAMPLLGRLGDVYGRKPVAILFIALNPLTVLGVFQAPGLLLLSLAFLAMNLSDIGSDHNLGVFAKELFPTSFRATAGSAAALFATLGGSAALAAESLLFARLGSHASAISCLALVGFAVPFLVGFTYPETRGRELEEISPEPR
jgi:MFS family permease